MNQSYGAGLERPEIRHFHLFCGVGGGAREFNRGSVRVGTMDATFQCLGGIDVNAAAIRDFERLVGVRGTVLDLFDRDQYRAFHGHEPLPGWHSTGPADRQTAGGNERPHIVFLSAPCKGFSGLLEETKSKTAKHQALNRLILRGVWLTLKAFQDDPPELILFENAPRIASRGRHLLDEIIGLLRACDRAVAETTHDCGQLGASRIMWNAPSVILQWETSLEHAGGPLGSPLKAATRYRPV
jgi:site-specific DNA-cytosine methylase